MTPHDRLSFIESHYFWLKTFAFLRGSSLAQLESLNKYYNGLVKMPVLPKDDFFCEWQIKQVLVPTLELISSVNKLEK